MGSVPLLRRSQKVRETIGQTGGRLVKMKTLQSPVYEVKTIKNKELGLRMLDVLQASRLRHLELRDLSEFLFYFFAKRRLFFHNCGFF